MPIFFCLDSLDTGGTHPVCMLGRGRRREREDEGSREGGKDKGKEEKGKGVTEEGERDRG